MVVNWGGKEAMSKILHRKEREKERESNLQNHLRTYVLKQSRKGGLGDMFCLQEVGMG